MKKIILLYFLSHISFIFFSCDQKNDSVTREIVKDLPPPNIMWIISEDNSKHYLKLFDENGVETPNINSLADGGLIYPNAFSNAPVCSVARSTLISGCYAPRIGAQYHRKRAMTKMPGDLKMFPQYLKDAGYYTTNNSKQDYNIIKTGEVWDESSKTASWKNRAEGQSFFHCVSIPTTHEGRLHFNSTVVDTHKTTVDIDKVHVAPIHPNTKLFKFTNAYYRDKIVQMDGQVGEILQQLKDDGLYDNTFIFYFGDHGGPLPGSKGYVQERGLNVPLVVHVPKNYTHLVSTETQIKNDFVSFVDFGATTLNLAGIVSPSEMDGKPFLGNGANVSNTAYGYADRFDEKYDFVRTIREGKYKYIRNYQPFNPDGLHNFYRYKQLAYLEWLELFKSNKLNETQAAFFKPRKAEQLFDIEADPYETNDLSTNPAYQDQLLHLRSKLTDWVKGMPDLSFYPESDMINNALDDATTFGQEHKNDISKYVDIVDLALEDFESIEDQLKSYLAADDVIERYWAIIAASSFGEKANSLKSKISEMAADDKNNLVRVRAAEFLGLLGISPVEDMTATLNQVTDPTEALIILNSVVLMQDGEHAYQFDISLDMLAEDVKNDQQMKRRLEYLGLISPE